MKYSRYLLVLLSVPLTILTVILLMAAVPQVLAMPKLRLIGRDAIVPLSVPRANLVFYLARERDIEVDADELLSSLQFGVAGADGSEIAVEPYRRFFYGREVEGVTYSCVSVFRMDGNTVGGPVQLRSNVSSLPNIQWAYSEGTFGRLIFAVILILVLYTIVLSVSVAKLFKPRGRKE